MRTFLDVRELSLEDFYRVISEHVEAVHLSDAKGSAGGKGNEHFL